MSNIDITRAWKDPEYRNSLSEQELAQLPPHPAGSINLTEAEMDAIVGGATRQSALNKDNFLVAFSPQKLQTMTTTVNDEQCCSSADLAPCGDIDFLCQEVV